MELADFKILLYGSPKVGKTTTANGFPSPIFLATEDGQRALECYRVPIDSWPAFLAAGRELAKASHSFQTVVIDTVSNLHSLCRRYVCEQHSIKHEAELPYGRGYGLVEDEFTGAVTRLTHLPFGLVFIAHAETEEVRTRTGSIHRVIPALPSRPRRFILGLVDIVLHATLMPERGPDGRTTMRRVVRTRPSDTYEAGDRTGRLPDPIDLGYAQIAAAFTAGGSEEKRDV